MIVQVAVNSPQPAGRHAKASFRRRPESRSKALVRGDSQKP